MEPTLFDIGEALVPTKPTPQTKGPPFLKVLPDHKLNCTCLSHVWIGATTHYVGRRMQLHQNQDCPWCANASERRFYAWLHCAIPNMTEDFILQLASSQRPVLSRQFDIHGTLRGSAITISRPGKNPNTPMVITFNGAPTQSDTLLPAVDLKLLLLARMNPTIQHKDQRGTPKPGSSPTEGN